MPSAVRLHIYDVSRDTLIAQVNEYLHPLGTGAFHGGVEVYGQEWSFGYTSSGTGVFPNEPRRCAVHRYRETVEMGNTSLSQQQVDQLIAAMRAEWQGTSYDLLRRNCCNFSDAFCQRLGVGHAPAWVTNLAGAGASLQDGILGAVTDVQKTAIMAAAKAGEVDAKYNVRGTTKAGARDVMYALKDANRTYKIRETANDVGAHFAAGTALAMYQVAQGAEEQRGPPSQQQQLRDDPFLQAADLPPTTVGEGPRSAGGAAAATSDLNRTIGHWVQVCCAGRDENGMAGDRRICA